MQQSACLSPKLVFLLMRYRRGEGGGALHCAKGGLCPRQLHGNYWNPEPDFQPGQKL